MRAALAFLDGDNRRARDLDFVGGLRLLDVNRFAGQPETLANLRWRNLFQ